MLLRLNLAALTSAELERLLGPDASRQRYAELSQAKLMQKPVLDQIMPSELDFSPLQGQDWGATPEDGRNIREWNKQLCELGFLAIGAYQLPEGVYPSRMLAFTGKQELAALRWSESPLRHPPQVLLLSWLREPIAGVAGLATTNAHQAPALEGSDEVLWKFEPTQPLDELLELHRSHVKQYGKATKVATAEDFAHTFKQLWHANLSAWRRRGVLQEARE